MQYNQTFFLFIFYYYYYYFRRCAICNSITNTTRGSGRYRRVLFLSGGAWMYSIFCSLLPLFGKGSFVFEGYKLNCSFDYLTQTLTNKLYVGFLFTCGFFIPMIVIIYSYSRIVLEVEKSRQSLLNITKHTRSSVTRRHKRRMRKYETVKIGMKLITMFVLSWGPYAAIAFTGQFINPQLIFPMLQLIPVVMAKSASAWNPIIYAISNRRFKRELSKIFMEKLCSGMTLTETSTDTHSRSPGNFNVEFNGNHEERAV